MVTSNPPKLYHEDINPTNPITSNENGIHTKISTKKEKPRVTWIHY